jgi:hypothetical protein
VPQLLQRKISSLAHYFGATQYSAHHYCALWEFMRQDSALLQRKHTVAILARCFALEPGRGFSADISGFDFRSATLLGRAGLRDSAAL